MKYTGEKAIEMFSMVFEMPPQKLKKLFTENQTENWIENAFFEINTPSFLQNTTEGDRYYDVFSLGIYMDQVSNLASPNKTQEEWEGKFYEFVPNFQIDYGDTHVLMNEGDCFAVFNTDTLAKHLLEMLEYEESYKTQGKCFVVQNAFSYHSMSFEDMEKAVNTFYQNKDNEDAIKELMEVLLNKERNLEVEYEH